MTFDSPVTAMQPCRVQVYAESRDWRWLWLRKRKEWMTVFNGFVTSWQRHSHGSSLHIEDADAVNSRRSTESAR